MRTPCLALLSWTCLLVSTARAEGEVQVDLSGLDPGGAIRASVEKDRLVLSWPIAAQEAGRIVVSLKPGGPLFESIGIGDTPILRSVDPVTFVTVGSRVNPPDRPAGMSVFNVFFDSPASRPFRRHQAALTLKNARVAGRAGRATLTVGDLKAGPFSGTLKVSLYAGSRLVQVEAVMATAEADRAFVYDAGLASDRPDWRRFAWVDVEGAARSEKADATADDRAIGVRHRAIAADGEHGAIACFPPPHQFFYPRDETTNQETAWFGRGHRDLEPRAGFGVRQTETGGGRFVPWFNAPPGTEQRMGVFYLLESGRAEEALRDALAYTHGDRFPDLPGHVTFTSHWHMAITMAAMAEAAKGGARTTPDFVKMFKNMNVRVVHLAEFHGDGHPGDAGPVRLKELAAMFEECRRLSDDRLLLLPGEEANSPISRKGPGRETGHWLYLFPRPVFWTMKRGRDQPFSETVEPHGKVYHVGGPADMLRLLEEEQGFGWTAHPRIKGSNFTPDAYRDEPIYASDRWLGAAWKAMPADLSSPRLGVRVLDLLDDMANWGPRKVVPGEVDVFKVDHTHELYGHMNVNYLKLDRAPRFEGDWSPVLDALRAGRFFVTTGEVLLRDFRVDGAGSGEEVAAGERPEVKVELEWTFPLRFAELVSGDGSRVFRERVDLTDTPPFGSRTLALRPDLSGRSWVRVEAWDVAGNGTFSPPIWLKKSLPGGPRSVDAP